jgi:hypothetical protein
VTDLTDPWAPPVPPTAADLSRWAVSETLLERTAASDLVEAAVRRRDAWWCALAATVVPVGILIALIMTRVSIWAIFGGLLVTAWFWFAAAGNARDARDARRG